MKKYTYDVEAFKENFERDMTWIGGFMRNVRRFGNKNAVIDPLCEKTVTYRQLNDDVNRFANALQECGFGRGDILFYQLYNSYRFILCYIAPQKLGGINSPANFNLSPGETARLIDRDRPAVYVYDRAFEKTAAQALELCVHKPKSVIAVSVNGDYSGLPEGYVSFDDFCGGFSSGEPLTDHVPDMYDEVTRLSTSGTTGTPKGVPLNNINEVMSAHDTIMSFPMDQSDVTMNMTPWFHRGGIHSGGPCPTLYVGGCVVIMRMFGAAACIRNIEMYGVTFIIGVPSALEKLWQRKQKHPTDAFSRLRGIVTMGSPLSREDCIRYQTGLTAKIFNGYGTTETYWNSFLRPCDLPEHSGSAGRSCIDDEVRVVKMIEGRRAEPDDTVLQDGITDGEIIIKTLGKTSYGYKVNDGVNADKYYKGWFYTSDVGRWDSDGFVTVVSRRDDMIVCMGENIYPAQIEEIICRHPKVADCMVTGVPDPSRGESVCAYIVRSDDSLTVSEINKFCVDNSDMSLYKRPRYYKFVDKLPYNATGKKQHVLLKEQAKNDLAEGSLLRPK